MVVSLGKFDGLYIGEEQHRETALRIIEGNPDLRLHISITEAAMDLADVFRKIGSDDEDIKVITIFGMRTFNAFGASLKLTLSGYHQNAALVLRDVLETAFLLDLFAGNRALITQWRLADKPTRMKNFSPVLVRKTLDERDGNTTKKRFAIYELFSELAGHPTMKSAWMMRPDKDGDAVIGPFMEASTLTAVLSEMGRLAIQVGEHLNKFFPADIKPGLDQRFAFAKLKLEWLNTFYLSPDAK